MRESQSKAVAVIMLAVFCAVLGFRANTIFAFDSEISIDKENLATLEDYSHLKTFIPAKYQHYIDSWIDAVNDGQDAYYEVGMWLDDTEDQGIIAATLTTPLPNSRTIKLVRDYSEDQVQYQLPAAIQDKMYYSLSELQQDFPPGEYTLTMKIKGQTTPLIAKATLPAYDSSSFPDYVDGSYEPGPGGVLQLHWNTVPTNDGEYEMWVENLNGMKDVFEIDNVWYTHPTTIDTTLDGAIAGKNDYELGIRAEEDYTHGDFHFELNSQRHWYIFKTSFNLIKQCTVMAGKTSSQPDDSILLTGQLSATEANLTNANPKEIKVTISSSDMITPYSESFPIDATTLKKGKYNCTLKNGKTNENFTYDCKTHKFGFSAKNVDLTGLWCPLTVTIEIGDDYKAEMTVNEDIANGPTKSLPIQLMMGVKNILQVDSFKVKYGKTDNSDSLTIKGVFTVKDAINKTNPFIANLGSHAFTVAGNKFATKGYVESCKAEADEGGNVTTSLDFAKCTFSIDVKNANITDYGLVDFGVNIFGVPVSNPAQLDLGPKRIFGLEELRMYDYDGAEWNYEDNYSYVIRSLGYSDSASDIVQGNIAVAYVTFNGLNCYETISSIPGSGADPVYTYWYSDAAGIHWAGYQSSSPNFGYTVESDLVIPPSVVIGRPVTVTGPFSGDIWLDTSNYGIYFTFDSIQGDATQTVNLLGYEEKTVSSGDTYNAVKGKYERSIKGNMAFTVDAPDYDIYYEGNAKFTGTCTQTFWAVPGVGIVAVDSKMNVTVSMSRIGSVSMTIKEKDSMTSYSIP